LPAKRPVPFWNGRPDRAHSLCSRVALVPRGRQDARARLDRSYERPVIISFTTSRPDPGQRVEVETFLGGFLPRLERQPGVMAVYHSSDEESGESTTLILWQD
jgi:hypothetical protein